MSGHVSEMAATARKYRNVVATIAKPFMSEALVTLVKETLVKGQLPPNEAAPAPAAPPRQGNGKKPAKKNGAGMTKAIAETPAAVESTQSATPSPLPPVQEAIPPTPTPSSSVVSQPRSGPTPLTQLAPSNGSLVVLGLGMEVIAVRFTPRFQIGAIRARPTASTLSLTHTSAPAENVLAGFEIGPVELDPRGRIQTMRVVPMRRPANSIQTRNGFEINNVALVNQNASIELTAGQAAPMTMQLVAVFKVAGVELSDRFEVAQLVLQPAGTRVRITLDPHSRAAGGAEFETVQVRLDSSRRIAEVILNSAAVQIV
jgi:hypothetical protein